MRVPLTELARSYYSRYFSAFPVELLPFGLQRFMQGRRLNIRIGKHRELKVRVVTWAFAWRDVRGRVSGLNSWVPVWYRLPLVKDDETNQVPLCQSCFPLRLGVERNSLSLAKHQLFDPAVAYINRTEALFDSTRRERSDISEVPDVPDELKFLRESGSRLIGWRGRTKEINFGTHTHDFEVLALLEVAETPNWEENRNLVNVALLACADACQQIFAGMPPNDGTSKSASGVNVELSLPKRSGKLKKQAITLPQAAKSATELVDRIIERANRYKGSASFNPLAMLFIVRCGEPRDAREQVGHARFLLGETQKELLQEKIISLSEKKELVPALVAQARTALKEIERYGKENPNLLKNRHDRLKHALVETLGLRQRSEAHLDGAMLFQDATLWSTTNGSMQRIARTFEENRFPVETVISNRIMGHGSCEEVHNLYEGRALYESLGDYPVGLFLAEQALLPEELKESLFYVPLMIPPAVTGGTLEGFFHSYAVAMAPDSMIDSEGFREIVEAESNTMYGALMMDPYRRLADAARVAGEVQYNLKHEPEFAIAPLSELNEILRLAFLDAIRLIDARKPDLIKEERFPFGIKRSTVIPEILKFFPTAQELDRISDHLFFSALIPLAEREAILTEATRNIWHGGIAAKLRDLVGNLAKARILDHPAALMKRIEDGLREAVALSLVLPKRAGWIFKHKQLTQEVTSKIYARAIEGVLSKYRPVSDDKEAEARIQTLQENAPAWIKFSSNFEILEEKAGLYAIFFALIDNIVRWEVLLPTIRPGSVSNITCAGWADFGAEAGRFLSQDELESISEFVGRSDCHQKRESLQPCGWGLKLEWVSRTQLYASSVPEELAQAWEQWRDEFKRAGGAVMISTFPFTGKAEDLKPTLTLGGEVQIGTAGGLGMSALRYLTRVYCEPPSNARQWPPSSIALAGLRDQGICVMVPGILL